MTRSKRTVKLIFSFYFLFGIIIDQNVDFVAATKTTIETTLHEDENDSSKPEEIISASGTTVLGKDDNGNERIHLKKETLENENNHDDVIDGEGDGNKSNYDHDDTVSTFNLEEEPLIDNYDATTTKDQIYIHGHWGTPSSGINSKSTTAGATTVHENNLNSNNEHHIPFVPNSHNNKGNDTSIHTFNQQYFYAPPDGFTFTARITSSSEFVDISSSTSSSTQKNNNDNHQNNIQHKKLLSIPYIECNNIGTTTPSITNHATFRHFPKSGAHPTTYTKILGMIIPLNPVEIQTSGNNEEESKIFYPGQIIWSDGGECKMTAPSGSDNDLSVLILNVDKKYIESQMRNGILFGNHIGRHDCFIGNGVGSSPGAGSNTSSNSNRGKVVFGDGALGGISVKDDITMGEGFNVGTAFIDAVKKIPTRKVILSSIGISLSTLFAYFLSKVAPLQLAVGIGGLCVVTGGTYATIFCGEWLCEEMEKAWEYIHNSGIIIQDNDLEGDDSEQINDIQNNVEDQVPINWI